MILVPLREFFPDQVPYPPVHVMADVEGYVTISSE